MKNVIVSAQMGAAGNLVQSILRLSNDVYWPNLDDRQQKIESQYPTHLKTDKKNWTDLEDCLDKTLYNPFLMDFDPRNDIAYEKPAVFVNHSLFWTLPDNFDEIRNRFDFVFVLPSTRFGLEWQCRAAFEKVISPHQNEYYDFCFFGRNQKDQIHQYIKEHGLDEYQRYNVLNMREIFYQQQCKILEKIGNDVVIFLEDLLLIPGEKIVQILNKNLKIKFDIEQVDSVLHKWRHLHWPITETFNWKYYE